MNSRGMRKPPCSRPHAVQLCAAPLFVRPDMRTCASVCRLHEGQQSTETRNIDQFRQHGCAVHVVVGSDSVDGQDCHVRVQLSCNSDGVSDTVRSCPGRQGKLQRSASHFNCVAEVASENLCDESTERTSGGDASDTSTSSSGGL